MAAAAAAALLGLTSGAGEGQARMPWEKTKDIYATFTFDMEGDKQPGEDLRQITVRLDPEWAPRGVKQFKDLAESGDFENAAVYHSKPGVWKMFGMPAEPLPEYPYIKDDKQKVDNKRGTIAFAQDYSHRRSNQLVFNLQDQKYADRKGIQPIGEVLGDGMEVIDKIFDGYGKKPVLDEIKQKGNKYLDEEFPKLTKIKSVKIFEPTEDAEM